MSLWNFFKKQGKRIAGTYGRINHPRDMRAANKGIRRSWEEMLECDEIPECEHLNKEFHSYIPGTLDSPAEPEGWYCADCETWLEPDDAATRLNI